MRSSVTVTEALVLRPLLEYRGPLLEYRGRITESIRVSPNFPDNCIPILSVFELCDTGGEGGHASNSRAELLFSHERFR